MLEESVRHVEGVGEKFAADLADMNSYTINDLLHTFPYRYNFMEIKKLQDCIQEENVTIISKIVQQPIRNFYWSRKSRLSFMIEVEGVTVKAVMFKRAFAKKQIEVDDTFTLTGKWDAHRLQITVATYFKGAADADGNIEPIY